MSKRNNKNKQKIKKEEQTMNAVKENTEEILPTNNMSVEEGQEQLHLNFEEEVGENFINSDEEVSETEEETEESSDEETESEEQTEEPTEEESEEETEEPTEEESEEETEEESEEETEEESEEDYSFKNMVNGKIYDCQKLNLREEPSKDSNVVEVLDESSILIVDKENSTEDFYKVEVNGKNGYCMKKFIKLD